MDNPIFQLDFRVRDYECDLQGVVNNAVYQNYLEHTRNEYLRSLGLSLAKLHEEGADPVVFRLEMDFLKPLISGDDFTSMLKVRRKNQLKYIFDQELIKKPAGKPVLQAIVVITFLTNGRPVPPPAFMIESLGL